MIGIKDWRVEGPQKSSHFFENGKKCPLSGTKEEFLSP
jgi:hypothetical protein